METIQSKRKSSLGIQLKLLFLLLFVTSLIIIIVVSGIWGLRQITAVSDRITQKEAPLIESIQEALSAMTVGQSAAERALDIDDPAALPQVDTLEQEFSNSVSRFNMFIAAIVWGSETDAFRRSSGGTNYKAWVDTGLYGKLVVQEPSPEDAQLAGEISIYYDGLVNNTIKAINARKEFLLFKQTGEIKLSEEARVRSKESIDKARRFSELTVNDLREIVRRSGQITAASAVELKATEAFVQRTSILISVIGLLISILISILFVRRVIITPITELRNAANLISQGNYNVRAPVRSDDEAGELATSFNRMGENLLIYTTKLESEVAKRTEELHKKVEEVNVNNELLKKRGNELTLANERLQELDKAKSEFISVAAHQLRTPLSAIKWTLSLVIDEESKNLTPEQRSLIMKGYESNERIIRLVNEMLVVTRIESGKMQYTLALFHIDDLIESVILDFAGLAHIRKMNLSFERSATPLPYVNADSEKIRGVIQNLIENSMRYTKDGGHVVVKTALENTMVKVSVTDNGIGIPVHQQSSIFNKFFRADNATKTQTDGSGLGLFVAKSVIDKQNGNIGFESKEGEGSTFYFTIPCAPATT